MERATKLLVLGWACAALALNVWLVGGWEALDPLALGALMAAMVLTTIDRRLIGVVLLFIYVFPAVIWLLHGTYHVYFSLVWLAALLGGLLPSSVRSGWHIPDPWRAALVCWALVVIASASIVFVREIDFTLALLRDSSVSNTPGGGWPAFIDTWVLHVALVLVIGILWFDWLFETSPGDFYWAIAAPMAASGLCMAMVAIYQLFVDASFMNPTVFGGMARASGTVFDANVCGTLAALWIGGAVLWAQQWGRWRPWVIAAGATSGWLAVWASGSRTAFAAATLVTAFSLVTLYVSWRRNASRLALPYVALGSAAVIGLLLLLSSAQLTVVGPIQRVWQTLPGLSVESVASFVAEMWNRDRYGSASSAMIRDFPWFGVGVGSFQTLLPEYALQTGGPLAPDNAQNWYRHQVAEFGVVGSLGWMAWVALFAAFLLRRRPGAPAVTWTGRGVLVAFALISLVGMPGQDVAVSITFWMMAFWYVSVAGVPAAPVSMKRWPAALSMVVVVAFAAGTAASAAGALRVPHRAQRVGWPYAYGFYPPEPDAAGGERRWTGRRAVAVIEAPTRWLALTVSVDHLAISGIAGSGHRSAAPTRPADVRVWCDGEVVVDERLATTAPVTRVVEVPDGEKWVLIETWVSRVIDPHDLGITDDRRLGLLVKWTFLDSPPARPVGRTDERPCFSTRAAA